MVHGLVSTPVDDTNVRVRVPLACACMLATVTVAESSAKPNKCRCMAMPLRTDHRVMSDGCIMAQRPSEIPRIGEVSFYDQKAKRSRNVRFGFNRDRGWRLHSRRDVCYGSVSHQSYFVPKRRSPASPKP